MRYDDKDTLRIGKKEIYCEEEIRDIPEMPLAEACAWLVELIGYPFNAPKAIGEFNDDLFLSYEGRARGREYLTPEERKQEEEERLLRAQQKAAAAAASKLAPKAEPAEPEPVEIDEEAAKRDMFRTWLNSSTPIGAIRDRVELYLRDGLEIPIRGSLTEDLIVRRNATPAEANEICDMLESYELHAWETEEEARGASSFTIPGYAQTYGSAVATGNFATGTAITTYTPSQTYRFFKPGVTVTIKMSNNAKSLEPYESFMFGHHTEPKDAAFLRQSLRQCLGIKPSS